MTDLKRYILIFLTGAIGYCIIEILWRGFTHPSMAVVGGICLLLIRYINRRFSDRPYAFRAMLCSFGISLIELASGILLNMVLHLNVWDYSAQPLNLMGQICPLYSFLWFFLSLAVIYFGNKIPAFR